MIAALSVRPAPPGQTRRAWSLLTIKAIDEDKRIIEGIATTPDTDRAGDIIEPEGAEFTLPIPLLWQHDTWSPVGEVFAAKVTPDGIAIKARIAQTDEPGTLKDRLDEVWQSVKLRLVRGLSVGFQDLESADIKGTYGIRFIKWLWLELSLVTIAANAAATIQTIKSLDMAAPGPHAPHTAGTLPVVRAKDAPRMNSTLQEQITSFENTRAAKAAAMLAIQTKAEGRTKDAQEREEFAALEQEIASVDLELIDLRKMEKIQVAKATPITQITNPETGSAARGGVTPITVKADVPKGTAFTRYVMAKIAGKGSRSDAIRYVEENKQWMDQTPEVLLMLKAAVNPGTIAEPAWAAPLAVAKPVDEFLELLRPATLIGKISGLRKVPFNISMAIQTGGGTYGWVGEGAPKPVGSLQFTSATLGIAKAAGIIVISQELAKLSTPSAEMVVRNDMIKGMAHFLDLQFITPTVAAVTNVSPASITNGAVSIGSAGTSAANALTDLKALASSLMTANQGQGGIASATFILSESNAFALATAQNPLGQPLFPGMNATGGTLLGLSAVTSQAAGTTVAIILPSEILFADDGGVEIDVSKEASLEMDSAPTSPVAAGTILVSLWQQNLIGLKAERFINWKRGRLGAVRYTTATYV